jgi:hypothetical protein
MNGVRTEGVERVARTSEGKLRRASSCVDAHGRQRTEGGRQTNVLMTSIA